jgi:CRP-like cAMP-binding protein
MALKLIKPADGSRAVLGEQESILIGQPPEVLKGLLLNKISHFDTLVLCDIYEKDGSLLNNLEFPLYFFLFVAKGLEQGRLLNLVGEADNISRALRLLRLTLLGPAKSELDAWGTEEGLKNEWLNAAEYLALKDDKQQVRSIESFFNIIPFKDGVAKTSHFEITHLSQDKYQLTYDGESSVEVDLHEDKEINPPYAMQSDFVPRDLVKLGLEILGSASGFTANEPCTGLALCYNGEYILIDSLPYLDKHLFARGISKNQISAVFLTHLHDDHCALFPLLLMPRKVNIISTREIYEMAMDKLSCHINWDIDVVKSFFEFIEVIPNASINYYGLEIKNHTTVHSIPTIGATFSMTYKGLRRSVCVIGDNHGMSAIKDMVKAGIVGEETYKKLQKIFTTRFDLLVADGGAGAIHGDPADALKSDSDRVVFVHVEHLSNKFNTTFSMASSGKRYTVMDGDSSIYTSLINHYLSLWLGEYLSDRWGRSILAEEEVRRYNKGDVIMVQGAQSRGNVFLIVTGYCEVVVSDGGNLETVATLQAGEVIGEMAVITGTRKRNASVVASSPVSVCVFSEDTFNAFISSEGHREKLLQRWKLRQEIRVLPQFESLISTVLENIANLTELEPLPADMVLSVNEGYWYLLAQGKAIINEEEELTIGSEVGYCPLTYLLTGKLRAISDCQLLKIPKDKIDQLIFDVPQFSYLIRKYRVDTNAPEINWLRGHVDIH